MSVTVKPLSRSLREWLDASDPENFIAGFEWDPSVYESMPRSITNPELAQGWQCIGAWTGWCNGVDLDYMASGGDGVSDEYFAYALPVGGVFPDDAEIIFYGTAEAAWTHVHADLAYGEWNIIFVVTQNSETPLHFWMDNIELIPSLVLTGYPTGPYAQQVPSGGLTLTPGVPSWAGGHFIPAAELLLTGYGPNFGTPVVPVPEGILTLTGRNPAYVWTLPASMRPSAQVIFYCILTGADDGLDDIYLPMSSFQARLRDGEPSYVSCVIPDSLTYEAAIIARENGDIVIQKGVRLIDGTEQMEEIARVDFESIQIDRGARNDSATITGHRTVTSSAPKDWTVEGVSFYGLQADGKRRIRAKMDLFLRCGDTCIYGTGGNDYFVVGAITEYVSANPPLFYMEVVEA